MIEKIIKNKWVCFIGGILLFAGILYLGYGIYGWVLRQTYKIFDVFMLVLTAMVIAFVLYIAGMGKDFLRGFTRAFLIYPALFILVMIPIKLRLERKVISYMEEPEDLEAEKAQADGQKIYFGLRAMGLTDREAEVARLAGSGMSNREIGQQLYIAEGTVKKHMTHILEKAGCADREELRERIRGMY